MSKNSIFDDVFRTICEKMPELLLPLINEVFGTEYTSSSKIVQLRNEHMTLNGKLITDSLMMVEKHLYHIECQSTDDSTMSIRMLDYDFSIAMENMIRAGSPYRLEFPESCIVYLRPGHGKSGTQPVEIVFPNGNKIQYSVKIINVQDYSLDDIFQKNLLMFLPYYILRYEKNLPSASKNGKEKTERLVKEYEKICAKLTNAGADGINENYYADLLSLVRQIIDHVVNVKKVRERIGDALMGGKVLTLWSEELLERGHSEGHLEGWNQGHSEGHLEGWNQGHSEGHLEGWNQGVYEGQNEGRAMMVYELVRDGDISLQKGAKRLGVTINELKENMLLAGYSYPAE